MNISLGGSMFVHNAIEFDYCVKEALGSLCQVCDDVVVVDASSTDGTLEWLKEIQQQQTHLRIVTDVPWGQGEKHHRLAILANIARRHLATDWHLMLQADEVLHENSFAAIRKAILNPRYRAYSVRRYNLFGDLNHYLRFDIPQQHKPCSDVIIRLASLEYEAVGDAESLGADVSTTDWSLTDQIFMYHYGMVRRDSNFIEKCIDMQSWFHDPNAVDPRILAMRESKRFDWEVMKSKDLLGRLPHRHPRFSERWAVERQQEKIAIID